MISYGFTGEFYQIFKEKNDNPVLKWTEDCDRSICWRPPLYMLKDNIFIASRTIVALYVGKGSRLFPGQLS